ncbi:MAG: DNA translocase FtsK [Bacillota bacterium]|nr:DNA translocase FtsK [Bacillota bacterium]
MAQTTTKKKTSGSSKSTAKKGSTKGKQSSSKKSSAPQKKPVRREIAAAIFGVLAILVVIGYFTGDDGFLVAAVCKVIKGLLGYGFYAVGPAFGLAAIILGFHRGRPVTWRTTSALLIPVVVSAFVDLIASKLILDETSSLIESLYTKGIDMECGGVIGSLISYGLENAITAVAAGIVLFLLIIIFTMAALNITFKKIYELVSARELPEYEEEPEPQRKPKMKKPVVEDEEPILEKPKKVKRGVDIPMDDEPVDEPVSIKKDAAVAAKKDEEKGILRNRSRVRPAREEKIDHTENVEPVSIEEAEKIAGVAPVNLQGNGRTAAAEVKEPPKKMSNDEMAAQTAAVAEEIESADKNGEYEKPPIFLLKKGHSVATDSAAELRTNRERLESAIKSFGVSAKVVDTTHGPTVTRYDVELEQGVKLSRLTNLAGDIALALGVVSVRIAPIPEKISTVGIEVPNKLVSTVYLRDIIDSPKFSKAKSDLTFAIGKDIGGEPVVGNISKLPHLLIAGTTGSGKSVCMNSLIISLLYKSTPDEVRFIMVDR